MIIKKVPMFDNLIEVSEDGKFIRNLATGNILHPYLEKTGYMRVKISLCQLNIQKVFTVHSIVADAFLGKCPENLQVDHIDRNKLNNHYSNLRYVTLSEQYKNRDYTLINKLNAAKSELAAEVNRKPVCFRYHNKSIFFKSVKDAIYTIARWNNLSFSQAKRRFYKHFKTGFNGIEFSYGRADF